VDQVVKYPVNGLLNVDPFFDLPHGDPLGR